MHEILAIAILSIGGVFLGLAFLIVVNKALRETRAWRERRRRSVLEPLLLDFVHGNEPSVRAALGRELRARERGIVEQVLLDHAQRVRGIERERLGKAVDELGYVDAYLRRLRSGRWWVRANAAEKLGLAGAARATPALAEALSDRESEVRIRAAKALGIVGGKASVRPLVAALNEPSRWSTIRIADILTSMGREVVDELLEGFDRLGLSGKLAALDVLARVHALRSCGWLEARLGDGEPDVRARACHALGAIGNPESGPALRRALADPEWPVRAMAAKALGRIHDADAIEPLCRALRDPQWWVRTNAAEALREVGPAGVAALEGMLDDEDHYARHQAVRILQEAGVVDERVGRLASTEAPGHQLAAGLVERLIRAGQTGRLDELSRVHPDARVRERLATMLAAGSAS